MLRIAGVHIKNGVKRQTDR